MTKAGISLADLNARDLGDKPFEIEYLDDRGRGTGVFLQVLGGQSRKVAETINELVNARRKAEQVAAARNRGSRPDSAEYTPIEDDIAFGQRLSAVRLVGWRGPGQTDGLTADQKDRFQPITDPWSPENALLLCQTNADISAQVLEESNKVGNFLKLSAPTS